MVRSKPETVLVVGASITGLTAALALKAYGFDVTIVEADAPPDGSINFENSNTWRRRGVPHAGHPHFFLGKLRKIMREWYPELMNDIRAAGIPEMDFETYLHPIAREGFKAKSCDEDLAIIAARRSTMELAMRKHIVDNQIAKIVTSATVTGLILEGENPPFTVCGVRTGTGVEQQEIRADIVIDGSGRSSRIPRYLSAAEIVCPEETYESPSAYYTRLYRLRPGQKQPELGGMPANLFGDFAIATFPADHGYFTVSLVVYKRDPILFNAALQKNETFEAICNSTIRGKLWIDPVRAEPVGNVISWANMDFLWRSTIKGRTPLLLNFFFAGDSAIRSNPKYGRGCTWSALGTHLLAETLSETKDPAARALAYDAKLKKTFRKEWQTLLTIDKQDTERFEIIAGLRKSSWRSWFYSALQNHLGNGAMIVDRHVARKLLHGYFGLDDPSRWMKSPTTWLRVAAALFPNREKAHVIAQNNTRPSRAELATVLANASRS
jgi:2-polyprenyl-6-methoxyphenol hydroxylase-like FAD-dependent oxidoreductase